MSIPNVERGERFAKWLVDNLSDLEFELLVRQRVAREFDRLHSMYPELCESLRSCSYTHSWNDESKWSARVGHNYRLYASQDGAVLSTTVRQAGMILEMQQDNTMSKLLPAPDSTEV